MKALTGVEDPFYVKRGSALPVSVQVCGLRDDATTGGGTMPSVITLTLHILSALRLLDISHATNKLHFKAI